MRGRAGVRMSTSCSSRRIGLCWKPPSWCRLRHSCGAVGMKRGLPSAPVHCTVEGVDCLLHSLTKHQASKKYWRCKIPRKPFQYCSLFLVLSLHNLRVRSSKSLYLYLNIGKCFVKVWFLHSGFSPNTEHGAPTRAHNLLRGGPAIPFHRRGPDTRLLPLCQWDLSFPECCHEI